jgi:hypothetical protein
MIVAVINAECEFQLDKHVQGGLSGRLGVARQGYDLLAPELTPGLLRHTSPGAREPVPEGFGLDVRKLGV